MAGTVLFPNEFPVNTLMHLCTNYTILIFAHIAGRENQKSQKLIFLILDPKPRKFEIQGRNDKISRFVTCQIMGDLP